MSKCVNSFKIIYIKWENENVCGEMVLIIIAWKRCEILMNVDLIIGVNSDDGITGMSIFGSLGDINDNELAYSMCVLSLRQNNLTWPYF